jgi:hypothetical protein
VAGGSGSGAKAGAKAGVKAGAKAGVKAGSQGWESRHGGLDFEELGLRGFEVSARARWLWTLMQVKGMMT